MPAEGQKKFKYTREYTGHQPNAVNGPSTWVLDTIVVPVDEKK
jgi:hypothetical protein